MSRSTVISVRSLGKRYDLGETFSSSTLRDALAAGAKHLFRGSNGRRPAAAEEFWAVRDVSFDVSEGEVVGIIGHNGAGKSTLLKMLSGITEPTEGEIRIRGRIGALLDVGTGFHQELSGRENIFMNGAILGMTQADIRKKFDEIVAFAGIERFLDTPVKRYSSGMLMRLGFAVAAHLDPEILVIDEVLAVGDTEFQWKCLGKMENVSKSGRTILFVSHNMAAVRSLCHLGVRLERGRVADRGEVGQVISRYLASLQVGSAQGDLAERQDRSGNGLARVHSITFHDAEGRSIERIATGHSLHIRIGYSAARGLVGACCQLALYNEWGVPITFLSPQYSRDLDSALPPSGTLECHIPELPLALGRYFVDFSLTSDGVKLDHVERAATFSVCDGGFFPSGTTPPPSYGALLSRHSWSLIS